MFVLTLLIAARGATADPLPRGPADDRGAPPSGPFRTEAPERVVDVVLGRPTTSSVVVRVLTASDMNGFVEYAAGGGSTGRTATFRFVGGVPRDVVLDGLRADTRYGYRLVGCDGTAEGGRPIADGLFHTARTSGRPFTFTVTADSHLDANTDPRIYAATLRRALADGPDFHIDLGDTFMTGKRGPSPEDARPQYVAQRGYFGLLCRSAPLFLVLGNHDGESGPATPAATAMRQAYFPNPVPDSFYTGSPDGNYYAWRWGDALFVVLDPFRYASRPQRGPAAGWTLSLGWKQYDWLARTLESRPARYRFILIHNLVGGLDRQARGGAEAVPFFEWGGHDLDGRDTFAERRPGWPMPIHALLVRHGVTAVFHGHDHFFARQEKDGIIYQLVPQPGHPGDGGHADAANYGYRSGDLRPGAGYLRVTVSDPAPAIEYVRTTAPTAE